MALRPAARRFTVGDYLRLELAGLLTEDDRVELIEGELIDMAPIGSPHAGIVTRLTRYLSGVPAKFALVSVQNPVHLDDMSEPQPDLMLLRPRADAYTRLHPRPADVLLLIEVADSSLDYDRTVKALLYARFAIPELWIVDIPNEVVHVFLGPTPDGYSHVQEWRAGSVVSPHTFPGSRLEVASLFA